MGLIFSFASDEYPEFVGTIYNDAFGLLIQGGTEYSTTTNVAVVPGSSDGIAVNTINNGQLGAWGVANPGSEAPWTGDHSDLFIPNSQHDPTDGTVGPYLEYDGLTVALLVSVDLTRATDYSFKIALGDAGDNSWDSAVFLSTGGVFAMTSATDNVYGVNNAHSVTGNIITDDTGDNVDVDPEDGQSTLSVIEVDGVTLSGGSVVLASGATLTIAADGSFDYDPTTSASLGALTSGQTATDTFTYTIQDDEGVTDTATVTINVNGSDPPAIDLDSTAGGLGYAEVFVEAGAAVNVTSTNVDITDPDNARIQEAVITLSGVADGDAEVVSFDGVDFQLGTSSSAVVTMGGRNFQIDYDSAAQTFVITDAGGGTMTHVAAERLFETITYSNNSVAPTVGDRLFDFFVTDTDGASNVAVATSTITVIASPESASWSISGSTNLDEGETGSYTISMAGSDASG